MLAIGSAVSYLFFSIAIPLVFTVSFLVTVWGAFQYFIAGGFDEEAREKGKSLVLYGLIVFAVMVLVWLVLRVITNALHLS